jgi:hypothetical protein
MRTHGFRTHILLAIAAAAGLLVTLGMPWFAVAPVATPLTDDDGSMERTLNTLGRAVVSSDGVTGWHALGPWATAIAGLAGLAALMSVLCLSLAVQGAAREGARVGALGALAVIAWRLVKHPEAGEELRHGALAAAGCALVLTSAALSVASAPLRRRKGSVFGHPGVYVPPPAPPRYEPGSTPPPGL